MCPHSTSGKQRPTGSVTARADAEVCSVKSSCWLRGGRELEMHFCLLSLPLPSSLHPTSSSPPSLLLSLLPIPLPPILSLFLLSSVPPTLPPSFLFSLSPSRSLAEASILLLGEEIGEARQAGLIQSWSGAASEGHLAMAGRYIVFPQATGWGKSSR